MDKPAPIVLSADDYARLAALVDAPPEPTAEQVRRYREYLAATRDPRA